MEVVVTQPANQTVTVTIVGQELIAETERVKTVEITPPAQTVAVIGLSNQGAPGPPGTPGMPGGLNFKGVWSNSATYAKDDVVLFGAADWYAKAGSNNSAPQENANWTLFLPGAVGLGVYNVLDYGAVRYNQGQISAPYRPGIEIPTGSVPADSTNAFNAAISAAQAHNGGIVYIPAGFYVGQITLPRYVSVMGDGPTTTIIHAPSNMGNGGIIQSLSVQQWLNGTNPSQVTSPGQQFIANIGVVGNVVYNNVRPPWYPGLTGPNQHNPSQVGDDPHGGQFGISQTTAQMRAGESGVVIVGLGGVGLQGALPGYNIQVDNVMAIGCKKDGVVISSLEEVYTSRLFVTLVGRYGIVAAAADSIWTNSVAAQCGSWSPPPGVPNWRGFWNSSTNYNFNNAGVVDNAGNQVGPDGVIYKGSFYVALQAGTNKSPDTSPTFWRLDTSMSVAGAGWYMPNGLPNLTVDYPSTIGSNIDQAFIQCWSGDNARSDWIVTAAGNRMVSCAAQNSPIGMEIIGSSSTATDGQGPGGTNYSLVCHDFMALGNQRLLVLDPSNSPSSVPTTFSGIDFEGYAVTANSIWQIRSLVQFKGPIARATVDNETGTDNRFKVGLTRSNIVSTSTFTQALDPAFTAIEYGTSLDGQFTGTYANSLAACAWTLDGVEAKRFNSGSGNLNTDVLDGSDYVMILTGNVFINAIKARGACIPGHKLAITLIQDGTGGRTVNWDTSFLSSPIVDTQPNASTYTEWINVTSDPLVAPKWKLISSAIVLQKSTFTASGTFVVPNNVFVIDAECWGGGGAGSSGGAATSGAGAGGGAYAKKRINVTPGQSYTVTVGSGGNNSVPSAGGDTWFGTSSTVLAKGGSPGSGISGGNGGASGSSIGDTKFSGGNGANQVSTTSGGGGGGAAGASGSGGNGSGTNGGVGGAGGGNGGNGGTGVGNDGTDGTPFGGAGGGGRSINVLGRNGASGGVIVSWGF